MTINHCLEKVFIKSKYYNTVMHFSLHFLLEFQTLLNYFINCARGNSSAYTYIYIPFAMVASVSEKSLNRWHLIWRVFESFHNIVNSQQSIENNWDTAQMAHRNIVFHYIWWVIRILLAAGRISTCWDRWVGLDECLFFRRISCKTWCDDRDFWFM